MKKILSAILVLCFMLMSGCVSWWATHLGGGHDRQDPLKMKAEMDVTALELVDYAYSIDAPLVDHHLHVVGNGEGLSGFCPATDFSDIPDGEQPGSWINPDRFDFNSGPVWWFKTRVLMDSMGVDYEDRDTADTQSLTRLENLVRGIIDKPSDEVCSLDNPNRDAHTVFNKPLRCKNYDVRIHLLAVDGHYEKEGTDFIKEKTDVYISNWYVIKLADCLNSRFGDAANPMNPFVPVVSINPYRFDAIKQVKNLAKELERLEDQGKLEKGSRFLKWVAPAMGFDPSDIYNNAFYRSVKKNGFVIMSHTGAEDALKVRDPAFRHLGDPRLMEAALDFGIPVVLSHAGGDDEKHYPGPADSFYDDLWSFKRTYHNNEHFVEMMASDKNEFEWCLFGDISALTIEKNFQHFNAFYGPDKGNFRYRMVYGSDYPLVATQALYPVDELIKQNFLDSKVKEPLQILFNYNPLAFDVAVKRLLAAPVKVDYPDNTEHLPKEMFMSVRENIKREHQHPEQVPFQRKQCHAWYEEYVGELNAS